MKTDENMMSELEWFDLELKKGLAELKARTYTVEVKGFCRLIMTGDEVITSITIKENAWKNGDKAHLELAITLAVNKALEAIKAEREKITERLVHQPAGDA